MSDHLDQSKFSNAGGHPEMEQPEPKNQILPLTEDEQKLLDELTDRQIAWHQQEYPDPEPDPVQERRYRLFFLYLMSRHVVDMDITVGWLQWVWNGYNKPKIRPTDENSRGGN